MRSEPAVTESDGETAVRRRRRPILTFGYLLVPVVALVAACGGGGDQPSDPTTTSSPVTSAPTSSARPSPTATSKPTSSLGNRTTTTAAGERTDVADGTHPVYLAGVDAGRRTISVDVVQVLDRKSAEAAKVCPEIARGEIDGYCIKNSNSRLRTLPVGVKASLRVLSGSSLRSVDMKGLAAARSPQRESSFFEVTVAGGQVTSVKELYRP